MSKLINNKRLSSGLHIARTSPASRPSGRNFQLVGVWLTYNLVKHLVGY